MNWFFLALACAFFTATTASLTKILLRKYDELYVGWISFAFSVPILLIALQFHQQSHYLTLDFWKIVALALPFEITALLLYLRALKVSPLSLTFPFLGLTPLFAILTSFLILRERPSFLGAGGIALVSIGAYLLNADTIKKGVLEPVKNIYKEKGSILMVIVALIYSITSSLGKKAVLLSSPLVFPVIYFGAFLIILTPIVHLKSKKSKIKMTRKDIFLSMAIGVSLALALLFHFRALSLAKVAYMISVKRLSLIMGVLYGAVIFKEKNIGFRLLGSSIMVIGIAILLLAG